MSTPSPEPPEAATASGLLTSPSTPRGPLKRLLLALPLLAIAALVSWVWQDAPHSRQLHLRFGSAAAGVTGVELSCQDEGGLESGARWTFTRGAPTEVTHTTSTTSAELECHISVDTTTGRRELTRRLRFDSDEARLLLETELR